MNEMIKLRRDNSQREITIDGVQKKLYNENTYARLLSFYCEYDSRPPPGMGSRSRSYHPSNVEVDVGSSERWIPMSGKVKYQVGLWTKEQYQRDEFQCLLNKLGGRDVRDLCKEAVGMELNAEKKANIIIECAINNRGDEPEKNQLLDSYIEFCVLLSKSQTQFRKALVEQTKKKFYEAIRNNKDDELNGHRWLTSAAVWIGVLAKGHKDTVLFTVKDVSELLLWMFKELCIISKYPVKCAICMRCCLMICGKRADDNPKQGNKLAWVYHFIDKVTENYEKELGSKEFFRVVDMYEMVGRKQALKLDQKPRPTVRTKSTVNWRSLYVDWVEEDITPDVKSLDMEDIEGLFSGIEAQIDDVDNYVVFMSRVLVPFWGDNVTSELKKCASGIKELLDRAGIDTSGKRYVQGALMALAMAAYDSKQENEVVFDIMIRFMKQFPYSWVLEELEYCIYDRTISDEERARFKDEISIPEYKIPPEKLDNLFEAPAENDE